MQGFCQSPIITHFRKFFKCICQLKLTIGREIKILAEDKISLEQLIALRGLRKDMIASELDITPSALSHKLKRRRGWKEKEKEQVCEIVGVHPRMVQW